MDAGISGAGASGRDARQARLEIFVGLVVALVLAVLVVLAMLGRHTWQDSGYLLQASFGHIDGLEVGSDVRLAGVTVGHVLRMQVDPKSFQAQVAFSVAPSVQLPADSGAVITSASLLGGKYIALTPGGESEMLHAGDVISQTQGAISLEQLLSKFVFTVTDSLQGKGKASLPSQGVAP